MMWMIVIVVGTRTLLMAMMLSLSAKRSTRHLWSKVDRPASLQRLSREKVFQALRTWITGMENHLVIRRTSTSPWLRSRSSTSVLTASLRVFRPRSCRIFRLEICIYLKHPATSWAKRYLCSLFCASDSCLQCQFIHSRRGIDLGAKYGKQQHSYF